MIKKMIFPILGVALGTLLFCPLSYGQEKSTTTTTSIETTRPTPVHHRKRRTAAPAPQTTEVMSTTTTTEVTPPPPHEVTRKVYTEDTLKKISSTLCTEGFKAYVGTEKKNVCKNKATAPDIAYTCVWDKKGASAFSPAGTGPCNLDYVQHEGTVKIDKETYPNSHPLDYGVEAQCCFRAAKGMETAASK